jgi:hypothetical protein
MQSERFTLNKEDLLKILKVFGWSMASSVVATAITILPQVDVPTKYTAIAGTLIIIINTLLVAVKKFIDGKKA